MADSAITIGAVLLILDGFAHHEKRARAPILSSRCRRHEIACGSSARESQGFCAGVERAIETVERALELHGGPIYVRHEIVHNRYVVENLRQGRYSSRSSTRCLRRHGDFQRARRLEAGAADAGAAASRCSTQPARSSRRCIEVAHAARGLRVVMIGHRGHPETEGTMEQAARGMHLIETVDDVAKLEIGTPDKVAYVTPDPLSIDDARAIVAALKARFRRSAARKRTTSATPQNRQDAVKWMAPLRGRHRGPGRRTARTRTGCARWPRTWARRPTWWTRSGCGLNGIFRQASSVTARASAPEVLVDELIARLKELGAADVRQLEGITETWCSRCAAGARAAA